jgi:hypothetical protein
MRIDEIDDGHHIISRHLKTSRNASFDAAQPGGAAPAYHTLSLALFSRSLA